MPGFNRTGPMGDGPMTGGARGYCNLSNIGSVRRFPRSDVGSGAFYGRGLRRGLGHGFRRGIQSYTDNADKEISILQQQVDSLNKRIADLKQ